MGAAAEPPLALFVPGTVCGVVAALAVVIAGSDLRPSEYPSAKNSAQIPTSPKNRTSSLPVPSVISVSCDDAIIQTPGRFSVACIMDHFKNRCALLPAPFSILILFLRVLGRCRLAIAFP